MTTSTLCCIHSEDRIDSPEPPARALTTIDGIFAAAALPEDHPHALKMPDRKVGTDIDIVQSPSITNKIRLQFRRSSLKELRKGGGYDDDARPMTLREALKEGEMVASGSEEDGEREKKNCDGELGRAAEISSKRSSINFSLPLGVAEKTNDTNETCRWLTKSVSSPLLLLNSEDAPSRAGELAPTSAPGESLCMSKQRGRVEANEELPTLPTHSDSAAHDSTATASAHVPEQTSAQSGSDALITDTQEADSTDTVTSSIGQGPHLHQMDISEQLRSMSQMSDIPAESSISEPWSFHRRARSSISAASIRDRHSRHISSLGMDSSALPPGWGRVHTPARDTSPSIYSRPGSVDVLSGEGTIAEQGQNGASDSGAVFADWPLQSSPICHDTPRASDTTLDQPPPYDGGERSLLSQEQARIAFRHLSSETTSTHADRASLRLLSPEPRSSSIPRKSSSSTITKASIASRFFERFSPPKKAVRKRKSMFKFLRPGSRKQQARSISSPMLNTGGAPDPAITLDGPSDDPALLTVQYELSDHPNQATRTGSMSMNALSVPPNQDTTHLAPPHHQLQRQPTLADYEKSLTVVGDDRRRPSSVNIQRAKEIHEDDRRDSGGLRKRLSRAHPLQDAASPLMAQALAKHQQEKALFRSASKQKEEPGRDSLSGSGFIGTSASTGRVSGTSLPPPSLRNQNDLLDPLEKGQLKYSSRRDRHLFPPSTSTHGKHPSSTATSPSLSIQIPSTVPSTLDLRSQPTQPLPKKRIGTNLESWSRYPSHSRAERCGSAGVADAVLTRDFAVDVNHEDIQIEDPDAIDPESPRSKKTAKSSGQKSRFSFPLRRSSGGFSGIVRYYSNLFHTRGWYGQNRRTSVTTGGLLEYPELEMLPPQMAESPRHTHHHGHPFQHFRDEIEKDVGKVKTYVRDEEAKIGGFVKKEEEKLTHLVKDKEEDWFLHGSSSGHQHHHHHGAYHHRASSCGSESRKGSPFKTEGIFETPSSSPHGNESRPHRSETMISPDETDSPPSNNHDGANDQPSPISPTRNESVKRTQSKAEIWSDLYKNLLHTGPETPNGDKKIPASSLTEQDQPRLTAQLKPIPTPPPPSKPRLKLDPGAKIRRYPSVTVIDDRKGHVRSVSLISVRTGRGSESKVDLLELIQGTER